MARNQAHGGHAPRASKKNSPSLSFHLGGLFLSPCSSPSPLSQKDGGGRSEHNTNQARTPPMRVRGKPLALSISVPSHSFSLCFPHRVMEEIPDVADPAAMSGRGSNEGWPNAGQVNSGFTSPGSSEVSPCSSSSPHACLWWDPAR